MTKELIEVPSSWVHAFAVVVSAFVGLGVGGFLYNMFYVMDFHLQVGKSVIIYLWLP